MMLMRDQGLGRRDYATRDEKTKRLKNEGMRKDWWALAARRRATALQVGQ